MNYDKYSDEELDLLFGYFRDAFGSGHIWGEGWEDSDTPHPGFGTYGGYCIQCVICGMYEYEFQSLTETPGKYEGQSCKEIIRREY